MSQVPALAHVAPLAPFQVQPVVLAVAGRPATAVWFQSEHAGAQTWEVGSQLLLVQSLFAVQVAPAVQMAVCTHAPVAAVHESDVQALLSLHRLVDVTVQTLFTQ